MIYFFFISLYHIFHCLNIPWHQLTHPHTHTHTHTHTTHTHTHTHTHTYIFVTVFFPPFLSTFTDITHHIHTLSLSLSSVSSLSVYIHMYIYNIHKSAHWHMGRVFTNGPGGRGLIPGRVKQKTQKMVLDASLLNTQYDRI